MTVARTVLAAQSAGAPNEIASATALVPFSVTDDEDTTASIVLGGLLPWRIVNESGGAATLTFYDAIAPDGTALAAYDEDGVAVAAMTIADDASEQCPTGLSGCTYLVVKGAAAADGFTLVCRR